MAPVVLIGRIIKNGNSLTFVIPRELLTEMGWNRDDRLAIRRHGNSIVAERIPLEKLALLRKPEQVQDAQ